MKRYDVAVIGGGPGGLAAALAARKAGADVLLIEREGRLGGILKQCIHDGFGLLRFGEKLSGPEYAARFAAKIPESGVTCALLTFVTRIEKSQDGFSLTLVSREGVRSVLAGRILFATGCRERTSRQIGVHGRHCGGIYTAGTAQHYVNLMGELPVRRCVVLGSGDIGLIMARRLTLEGAQVIGVYEAKPTPSGLTRNISQCLWDFDIPLYTGRTVTRVLGEQRLTAVEISHVDAAMRPIPGTEEIIPCDGLILSVGLIPENELAETLDIPMDPRTKGPLVDQFLQTMVPGVFCCGNALHVNDLVDYVSESGELAGKSAAACGDSPSFPYAMVEPDASLLYAVPQRLDTGKLDTPVVFFFRAAREMEHAVLTIRIHDTIWMTKRYAALRPPEMERLELRLSDAGLMPGDVLSLSLQEEKP